MIPSDGPGRAELADESPGTPLGRLNAIAVATEARGLCSGVEAKAAEVFLIEAFDALRAELADVKEQLHYANGTCDLAMKHRNTAEAAARQDAEKIARLRLALKGMLRYLEDHDDRDGASRTSDPPEWEAAERTLACAPNLQDLDGNNIDYDPITLTCRPKGKKS